LLSEILEDRPIPESTLIYFRERFRDRLHSAILGAFLLRAEEKDLTRSDLATRIHRTKAQISRWFSAPSNITLDSISDLMVGLGMDFDAFPFTPIENTIAAEEEEQEATVSDGIFSTLGTTKLTVDLLAELNETLKRWMEETQSRPIPSIPTSLSAGDARDATKPLQKQDGAGKVISLDEYRLKSNAGVDDRNRNLLQIGAR